MEWQIEILPPEQLAVWKALERSDLAGFVLYGGTALALRFGHRESIDFDFFTGQPVSAEAIYKRIPWLEDCFESTLQLECNTFVFTTRPPGEKSNAPVKLSFFGGLDLPIIQEPDLAPNRVSVASTKDLLATKLKVINQRIEVKDYIDIAEILQRSGSPTPTLEEGLANVQAMYPEAAPSETLKALCWFRGGDLERLKPETKAFLEKTVKNVGALPGTSVRSNVGLKNWSGPLNSGHVPDLGTP